MATQDYYKKISIILLGDSCVGKTCFFNWFLNERFIQNYGTTIGIDIAEKIVCYNNKKIRIMLSDTAGQERFRSITRNFYKRADGILLFFDITNRTSFQTLSGWKNDIDSNIGYDSKISIVLVGTHHDKQDKREISYDEAMNLAQVINIPYYECSSVTGYNVTNIINELVKSCLINQNILEDNQSIALSKKSYKVRSSCCSIF